MSIADKKLFQGYFGAPYTTWILVQRMDSNDNIVVCLLGPNPMTILPLYYFFQAFFVACFISFFYVWPIKRNRIIVWVEYFQGVVPFKTYDNEAEQRLVIDPRGIIARRRFNISIPKFFS